MRKQNSIGIAFPRFMVISMIDLFKRALSGLIKRRIPHEAKPRGPRSEVEPSIALDGPNWHGDHWANLLSSPMDARHYVLEDWPAS